MTMWFTAESLEMLEESKRKRLMYRADDSVVSSIDYRGMGLDPAQNDNTMMSFTIGASYSLTTPSCRGFKPVTRIFQVVGIIDELNGMAISSIIAKQIGGPRVSLFSISEAECEKYGVEYEENLMILPKFLSWKRFFKNTSFTDKDLSTTPKSENDGLIHQFLLRVTGFKDLPKGYVVSPSGKVVRERDIEKSLTIKLKRPLVWGDGDSFNGTKVVEEGLKFLGKIVYPKSKDFLFKNGNFIASDNSMYILVDTMVFGIDGVDPKYLEEVSTTDLFEVSWDEGESMTLEEMKKKAEIAKKAREKKESSERKAIMRMNAEIEAVTKAMERALSSLDNEVRRISIVQSDDPELDLKFDNLHKITNLVI